MTDLYLKAATEAAMNAVLIDAGLAYDDDGVLTPASDVSLDVIGVITRVVDEKPVALDGWHVNVRTPSLTEEQEAEIEPLHIVPPERPFRVWA